MAFLVHADKTSSCMGPTTDHVPNHFVYPLNPDSGYIFSEDAPTDYSNFIRLVRYDKSSEWGLKSNFRQIQDGDFIWAYFCKPDGHIRAVGRACGGPFKGSKGFPGWRLKIDWDESLIGNLRSRPIPHSDFGQKIIVTATTPNDRTSRALRDWLAEHR